MGMVWIVRILTLILLLHGGYLIRRYVLSSEMYRQIIKENKALKELTRKDPE